MPAFIGNTTSLAISQPYNIAGRIKYFSIVNKSGSTVTINVGLLYGSTYLIIPMDKSLASGEAYIYSGEGILIPAGYSISIVASDSVDYNFSIK